MAHQIENNEIAWTGAVPWHGLGTRMPEDAEPAAFLEAANLAWPVERRRLIAVGEDGRQDDVGGRYAFVCGDTGKTLTIAGPHWRPLQNADAIDFMARYVRAGGARMETVGALQGGRIIWGLARLGHAFEVRPGDRTEGYLLITSPHIVGTAISIRTTTVRVVCANTLALAEQGRVTYRQNHLADFDVEAAREAVAGAHETLAEAERRARTLDRLKMSMEDAARRVVVPVFAPEAQEAVDWQPAGMLLDSKALPRSAMAVLKSIAEAPGATPGTGWGVLNGITHYCDHVVGRSGDARLTSAWMGHNARNKLRAEKLLLDLAA